MSSDNPDECSVQASTYDNARRLSQIQYQKSDTSLIEQIDYGYDAAGQLISKTTLNASSAAETPMSAAYDSANRMSSITLSVGDSTKTYRLSWDDNGNLINKQNTAEPSDQTSYSWDVRDRLIGLGPVHTIFTSANVVKTAPI